MPLTTTGICIQILSSISTYRRERDRCSENDCKVVLNVLIRKFSEPLAKQGRQRVYVSPSAKTYVGKTFKDHVFPVGEIMSQLLALPDDALAPTDANVARLDAMLADMLVLVTITDIENAALNAAGCQRRMPKAWSDPGHQHFQDPWARYKAVGISELVGNDTQSC